MQPIIDNQFGKNAAVKPQLGSDRYNESRHTRFIELCGSQAQNNRGMAFAALLATRGGIAIRGRRSLKETE
jgi:hypothetical protein